MANDDETIKKKQKAMKEMKDYLSNLPDEMKLHILEFNTEDEIKKTRTLSHDFQSKLVKRLTKFVKMEDAIRLHNLDNMKWIKERYNGSILWHDDIKFDMAIGNLNIMKWLHENGVKWCKNTFQLAAKEGDIATMEWLYKKKCPWSETNFDWPIRSGDLDTIKWLFKKECQWDEFSFADAAFNGDLDIMEWLYENQCPFDESCFADAAFNGDLENMEWLKEHGCPWGEETFEVAAARHGNLGIMEWLYENDCPWNTTVEICRTHMIYKNAPTVEEYVLEWMKDHGCPEF